PYDAGLGAYHPRGAMDLDIIPGKVSPHPSSLSPSEVSNSAVGVEFSHIVRRYRTGELWFHLIFVGIVDEWNLFFSREAKIWSQDAVSPGRCSGRHVSPRAGSMISTQPKQ
ncbi:MAG: hypothetical protein ABJI23_19620, partial [Marinobacter sp.]|uniref:hypothetical protein n=1 Tax=Marinobacter sp. TaxID=50741 RepID=UPI00329949B2